MEDMRSKNYIVDHESALPQTAAQILDDLEHPIVLLIGDLGAGKTSLVKAMLGKLNTQDTTSSPSFSLINEYRIENGKTVYHIDLYRLEDVNEVFNLGIEEYLYSGNYCFIEWPQIIIDYIDSPYHTIHIDILENNSRKITLS